MNERNYWKYATIIIIMIIIILSGIIYYNYDKIKKAESYNFNGLKINKIVFDEMANQFEPDEAFRICRMKDNYCVEFNRG